MEMTQFDAFGVDDTLTTAAEAVVLIGIRLTDFTTGCVRTRGSDFISVTGADCCIKICDAGWASEACDIGWAA